MCCGSEVGNFPVKSLASLNKVTLRSDTVQLPLIFPIITSSGLMDLHSITGLPTFSDNLFDSRRKCVIRYLSA